MTSIRIRVIQGLVVALASTMLLLLTCSVVLADAKNRNLHATKACPGVVTGAPGGSCVFTSSTLGLIVVGSQILYDQLPYLRVLADPTSGLLDSNVVLDAGDGNRAVGRCTLDFQTLLGLCTFSDGTGTFAGFEARVDVDCTPTGSPCTWDGTYGFRPKPHR
jgi:hypothetical protein